MKSPGFPVKASPQFTSKLAKGREKVKDSALDNLTTGCHCFFFKISKYFTVNPQD